MTQTFPSDMAKDALNQKIDETMAKVSAPESDQSNLISELYDVIRWSRKGYLTRKVETDETTK